MESILNSKQILTTLSSMGYKVSNNIELNNTKLNIINKLLQELEILEEKIRDLDNSIRMIGEQNGKSK